jgi:long-chain acyl-CoA synthetase
MLPTIPARLQEQARTRPTAVAYRHKENGEWRSVSWREYVGQVNQAAKSLLSLGFRPGETTCILGFNRPEWCILDHATMALGGAPAGIYTTSSPDEVAWIVSHAESRFVLVENEAQFRKVEARLDALPRLERVILMRGANVAHPKALGWEAFLRLGDAVPAAEVAARIAALEPDQLATLIYTSGTTGLPKGVMLSHDNLAWTAAQISDVFQPTADDAVLSYLPLSHIAEQVFTLHGPATFGFPVWFAESMERLADNIKEAHPTIFFGVPRVWEKFHAGVSAKLAGATGVKARLASWALEVGGRVAAQKNRGVAPNPVLGAQHRLADKLVLSKVRDALGFDRARICVSGAAPINAEVLEFLAKLGLTVLEVYGQSEGTGPSSVARVGNVKFGTVGPPYPGVELRIADDGEVLVRGRNVFLGYFKDPEATAETLVDGWLHSGDLGAFDSEGYLSITGRKKELIITAGGKNIAPRALESALKEHPVVGEVVVIGDRRRFLSALVVVNPAEADALARKYGVYPDKLHQSPEVEAEVQRAVDAANARFARVEHIRKFVLLPRPLTIEAGELTPTLKVKRKVVAQNWAREIEAMYAEPSDEAKSA